MIYESPSGVPPGSSIGPQMFTVFIDDIVNVVSFAKALLFADDIKLAAIIQDHSDINRLQQDRQRSSVVCKQSNILQRRKMLHL